jgi:cytochrome c553
MWRALPLLVLLSAPAARADVTIDPAEGLYGRLCLPCHGELGDGRGPAASLFDPPPRDFTAGAFKFRSTEPGTAPLVEDLERTIARGVPGTWMPAWEGTLTAAQIRALAKRVIAFGSPARAVAPAVPLPPASLAGDATRGRTVWERAGCGECHGQGGAGDGPAAPTLRTDDGRPAVPYDLRLSAFRGGAGPADLVRSVALGIEGTPMPAYRDALGDQELVDLAAHLRAAQDRALLGRPADGGALPVLHDADAVAVRVLPAVPDGPEARGFHRFPIPRQGLPPAHLTAAEASLEPRQCGRCHAEQLRTWEASLHARTHGPGFTGQMPGAERRFTYECHRCHAPMTEQLPFVDVEGALEPNPHEVPGLADTGVGCAVCHLRGHVRHGPPPAEPRRLALPSYPLRVLGKFERGDFCMPCHQHTMDAAVNGRPPLDTFREWVASPYYRRGVQCQSCHMPDRAHTWKGIHDPATVRQALHVEASLARAGRRVEVTVRLTNAAAGHMLPTTVTPVILVHAAFVDGDGTPLAGTDRILDRVERSLFFRDGRWNERHDTRIAPGRTRVSRFAAPSPVGAQAVRVEIEVRPDYAYEGVYRALIKGARGRAREQLRAAYARTVSSPFVAVTRDLPLTSPAGPPH